MRKLKLLFDRKPKPDPSNMGFEVKDSDVFLVSYPKSGNTWTRFLIGNYLTEGKMDFTNGHLFMPDVHYNPQDIKNIPFSTRFIKSHFPYRSEYSRVIYVVRDGRDTAVSLYFFLRKLGNIDLKTTFSEFLENYFFKGKSPYGQWDAHIFSWLKNKKTDLLLIKYENMLDNTVEELEKMIRFAGLEVKPDMIRLAVEKASFEEMKNDEKAKAEFLKTMGHDNTRTSYGFIREGKKKGYREHFNAEQLEKFWALYGQAMTFLGYEK